MPRSPGPTPSMCIAAAGLLLAVTQLGVVAERSRAELVTSADAAAASRGPYDLTRPSAVHRLPTSLREISGLTLLDERHLGAVQDEDGVLYVIDTESGRVTRSVRFASPGDYEGLERVGELIYALRSDGMLLELDGVTGQDPPTRTHRMDLEPWFDAEGLAYDPDRHLLLVACKEGSGAGASRRAVRAFDLATRSLLPDPAHLLDAGRPGGSIPREDPAPPASAAGTPEAADARFKPAAIAVHPLTGDRYVLSSTDRALVTLSRDGVPIDFRVLPEGLAEQPEGLAFLPDGDLFIASEGVRGAAVLLRFDYRGPR